MVTTAIPLVPMVTNDCQWQNFRRYWYAIGTIGKTLNARCIRRERTGKVGTKSRTKQFAIPWRGVGRNWIRTRYRPYSIISSSGPGQSKCITQTRYIKSGPDPDLKILKSGPRFLFRLTLIKSGPRLKIDTIRTRVLSSKSESASGCYNYAIKSLNIVMTFCTSIP